MGTARIRTLALTLAVLSAGTIVCIGACLAGPNAGGTLVIHQCLEGCFSLGEDIPPSLCGYGPLPQDCSEVEPRHDGHETTVWHVFAAFPDGSNPRLQGITFGVEYDEFQIGIVDWGGCGDFELRTSAWPRSGEGTAVTWAAALTGHFEEVYWLAGYSYYDGVEFSLAPHPNQGGWFADDSIPADLDPIVDYGRLGFNHASGYVPCPPSIIPGACCFEEDCLDVPESECDAAGGLFQGEGTECADDPCPKAINGACCFEDGRCLFRNRYDCEDVGGEYWGDGTDCTPNPCPQPPVGACCFPDGSCTQRDSFDCARDGGIWVGEMLCDPNPCPQPPAGACCFENGSCLFVDSFECAALGGAWRGPNSVCEPNPCPQPRFGACCFVDLSCQDLIEPECVTQGGIFLDGALCAETDCLMPCPSPPIAPSGSASGPVSRTGPNIGGVLILHAEPGLVYSNGGTNYCGQTAVPACEASIDRSDSTEPVIVHVLAAFRPEAPRRLQGVSFGVSFPDCVALLDHGGCGDLETTTPTWPASGSGTAISWEVAQQQPIVEVYWFAAYVQGKQPAVLALAPHPTDGAIFVDDANPPNVDPVAFLGSFGFRMDGSRRCPPRFRRWEQKAQPAGAAGACCIGDTCFLVSAQDCTASDGAFEGPGVACDPGNCDPGSTEESSWGRIKQRFQGEVRR